MSALWLWFAPRTSCAAWVSVLTACAGDVPGWLSSPEGETKKMPLPGAGAMHEPLPPLELPELPPLVEPELLPPELVPPELPLLELPLPLDPDEPELLAPLELP